MIDEIKAFMCGSLQNSWVYDPKRNVQIYMRRSYRIFDGVELYPVLDVANVVIKRHLRSKGRFTKIMNFIEANAEQYGFKAIYVESIIEPRLVKFFKSRGYRPHILTDPPCLYKMAVKEIHNETDRTRIEEDDRAEVHFSN